MTPPHNSVSNRMYGTERAVMLQTRVIDATNNRMTKKKKAMAIVKITPILQIPPDKRGKGRKVAIGIEFRSPAETRRENNQAF